MSTPVWTEEMEAELRDMLWRGRGVGVGGLAPINDRELASFARRAIPAVVDELKRLRGACRDLVAEKERLGAELARANLDLAELALQSRVGPPPALQDEADRAAGRRRARRRK